MNIFQVTVPVCDSPRLAQTIHWQAQKTGEIIPVALNTFFVKTELSSVEFYSKVFFDQLAHTDAYITDVKGFYGQAPLSAWLFMQPVVKGQDKQKY